MKTAAIIAEYNPFHNGHAYHIEQTRNNGYSHIIAVMSGNYVQRGTPAVLDRFMRAKQAVQCGADLVIELPLPWSSSAAPDFADGAIQLIKATKVTDALSFGCEDDNPDLLKLAINLINSPLIQNEIRNNIQKGECYPAAVAKSLQKTNNAEIYDFLSKPNNMLAFEYCKQLDGTSISPLPIKRIGCSHDSDEYCNHFASASYVRNLIYKMYNSDMEFYNLYNFLPKQSADILNAALSDKSAPPDSDKFSLSCISRLQSMTQQDFSLLPYVNNGLENRLFNTVQSSVTLDEAYNTAKNKQVTHARIRRTLLQASLGMHKWPPMKTVPYIRVLAMNSKGRELLKTMQRTASLPIIMRHADTEMLDSYAAEVYNFNQQANDFYNLCLPTPKPCGYDKTRNIYIEL